MAKRKPPKAAPLTRAGRELRERQQRVARISASLRAPPAVTVAEPAPAVRGEGSKPRVDKAAAHVKPSAADLRAKREALHAALAAKVRGGDQSAIGIPISEQDQGVGVVTSHDSGAVMDASSAVMDGRATKPEKRAGLSTSAADAIGVPVKRKAVRPTFRKVLGKAPKALSNGPQVLSSPRESRFTFPPYVEPAPAPQPEPGTYRIEELGFEQCRYACNDAGREGHRFCGAPAPIGPGNVHGSWCEAHRARVFGQGSVGERNAHVIGKRVRLG